jgi:predicted DCC family thiol-disulfide oxidoreductase YuxK
MTTRLRPAQVFYDGQCLFCVKSVNLLKTFDWFGRLSFFDSRHPELGPANGPTFDRNRLLEEIHLVPPNGTTELTGFFAFRWIAWRLPLFWPLAPFLYLPGAARWGQRLYLWIARNRFRLVPCHGGVCRTMHAAQEPSTSPNDRA